MDDRIWSLVEPVVSGLGYELWGIEVQGYSHKATVRVYIDTLKVEEDKADIASTDIESTNIESMETAGINVEDCAKVSRQLSSLFDVEDPFEAGYTLEVSSPGLDRRLFTKNQFLLYVGAKVKVRLKSPFEGRKRFTGLLCGMEGEDVVIRSGDEEMLFPFAEIDRANLVSEF